jgi:dephospho-CoA kinase
MIGLGSKTPVLGLVGGIGSGKSRVADELKKYGAYIISGDKLGHEALQQADIKEQIVKRWGLEVSNPAGEIDRRRLGAIVFADPEERWALEGMVFPYIERRLREEIARARDTTGINLVVMDAAVMFEAGWNELCDRIVYIDAPESVRWQRVISERGWSAREVAARERAQMSQTDKKNRADFVVDNSGPPELLGPQLEQVLRKMEITI